MAWLNSRSLSNEDDRQVLSNIRKRVVLLTGLPEYLIHSDMELQVVHYPPTTSGTNVNKEGDIESKTGGHYTAHFDSLPIDPSLPCCHIVHRKAPCRPCRLATILYSLSDLDVGGHTAFPLVNDTRRIENHTADTIEAWRLSSASRESSYCAEDGPGLRIRPALGQAIFWFNHHHTDETLLRDLDRSTIHAGCPGSTIQQPSSSDRNGKWIANHWIEASDIVAEDKLHYGKIMEGSTS